MKITQPLTGIRVVDLTNVIMGPLVTQILGSFGADVIKVEAPEGDIARRLGQTLHPGMSSFFMQVNCNKRAIALDLKQPEGRSALLKLIAGADVLVTNVRPRAMARLGLSYQEIIKINSRIVYLSLTGYAEKGPYAGRPAYDDIIQAAVGMPRLLERVAGAPLYIPQNLMDRSVGLYATSCLLAALLFRERSGQGQELEIPMFETMSSVVLGDHMQGATFEPRVGDAGYVRLLNPHRTPYRTRDGLISAVIYSDEHWRKFLAMVNREDLLAEPRFATLADRQRNGKDYHDLIQDHLATQSSAEWLALLLAADIPAVNIPTLDELIDDPHLKAVGLIHQVQHPSEGPLNLVGTPGTWSATPPILSHLPPRLGQHTREVLTEAGMAPAAIDRLVAAGCAIEAAPLPQRADAEA